MGGSGQGPAGSLAGSWGTGPVRGRGGGGPGGSGHPQPGAPPELRWSLTCTCPEGRPLASTLGTSPELMKPETSNHRIQLPTLTGASPGSTNSAPLGLPPQKTCELGPQCLAGGASLLQCLLPAVGEAR